jgi:hypothetical protein
VVRPAGRSAKATSSVLGGTGDRDAASDGFRTHMMMLLTSAPVLMDDPVARHFLEQSQYLGGVMARARGGGQGGGQWRGAGCGA